MAGPRWAGNGAAGSAGRVSISVWADNVGYHSKLQSRLKRYYVMSDLELVAVCVRVLEGGRDRDRDRDRQTREGLLT